MDMLEKNSPFPERSASLTAVTFALTIALLLLKQKLKGRDQKQGRARSQVLRKVLARHAVHERGSKGVHGSPDSPHNTLPAPHTEAATRHLLLRAASRLTALARAGSETLRRRKVTVDDSLASRQSLPTLDHGSSTRLALFDSWPNSAPVIERIVLSHSNVTTPGLRSDCHQSAPSLRRPPVVVAK